MLGIVGQGILLGIDAMIPTLNRIQPIESVEIKNANYDYLYATTNVLSDLPTSLPTTWAADTIMHCDFNNLNVGNVGFLSGNISKILVKRCTVENVLGTEVESEYITLFEIPIAADADIEINVNDFTNVYGEIYKYKLIPVFNQTGAEGSGSATKVESSFDGVFLCDSETFIKLRAGVEYGSMQTTQITGVHETLGGKYPIVVANSNVNYHSGSLSATVINKDFGTLDEDGRYIQLDRQKIIEARKELDAFLTTKTPKIIKDDSGNAWLVIFTDNVSYDFFNEWGKDLGNIAVSWTEIGDAEDGDDLTRTGLIGGEA